MKRMLIIFVFISGCCSDAETDWHSYWSALIKQTLFNNNEYIYRIITITLKPEEYKIIFGIPLAELKNSIYKLKITNDSVMQILNTDYIMNKIEFNGTDIILSFINKVN